MTIESKTADTILERKKEIVINGKTYQVAPPSTATLIEISELVAQMPQVELSPNDIATETLRIARYCKIEGDIVACLVLGEGRHIDTKVIHKKRFFGLKTEILTTDIDLKAELAKEALKMPTSELHKIAIKLLAGLEYADFFAITTFLIEINLTKATREVVETTAFGR